MTFENSVKFQHPTGRLVFEVTIPEIGISVRVTKNGAMFYTRFGKEDLNSASVPMLVRAVVTQWQKAERSAKVSRPGFAIPAVARNLYRLRKISVRGVSERAYRSVLISEESGKKVQLDRDSILRDFSDTEWQEYADLFDQYDEVDAQLTAFSEDHRNREIPSFPESLVVPCEFDAETHRFRCSIDGETIESDSQVELEMNAKVLVRTRRLPWVVIFDDDGHYYVAPNESLYGTCYSSRDDAEAFAKLSNLTHSRTLPLAAWLKDPDRAFNFSIFGR